MERKGSNVDAVIGPDGTALTIDKLPPARNNRWVARRKAEVVIAVRGGLLTIEEACERYALSYEEFLTWDRALKNFGVIGLQATRISKSTPERPERPKSVAPMVEQFSK
jgi:hypothetical protein